MEAEYDVIVFVSGTLILLLFTVFLVVALIQYKKKQQKHLTEKMQLEHTYRTQILQTQLEVQEQSFKYFSEEIHDNIGQMLSLVKMQLYKASSKSKDEGVAEDINKSTELLGRTINELRGLSHTLNGSFVSKMGLVDSLEKELQYISNIKSIECKLDITGTPYALKDGNELILFRIAQEAINNVIKYAEARKIIIKLVFEPRLLAVTILDDGKGFDANLQTNGMGLHNMRTRSQLLGGMLQLESSKGYGTTINVNIPTYDQ